MARKSRQNQDSTPALIRYAKHTLPFLFEIFTAWRDRPRWEEVQKDLELLAARTEKHASRVRILTILVIFLFLWCAGLTVFVLRGL